MGRQAAPNIHLCPCHGLGPLWPFSQLLNKQLGCLGLRFPGPTHPPSPPTYPPTPLIHNTCDITESFQNPASCQHKTCVLLVKIWHGYNQASVNCSVLNISNSDFLKMQNVTLQSVFLNPVTYTYNIIRKYTGIDKQL